jgi:hypothetical protein
MKTGGYPLRETQRLWNIVRAAADQAAAEARETAAEAGADDPLAQFHTGRQAGFVACLNFIEEVDPGAETGPVDPDVEYGPIGSRTEEA